MFSFIASIDNLYYAWYEFRRGKRDRSDVMAFERHLEDNIFALHEELTLGTYRHGLYHQFHIFDPKHRVIHKATVRDRLVHHAVHRVLLPMFDRSFIHDSYSCRDEKGTHAAVRRMEGFARRVSGNFTKPCWALKFDVRKFFDSVDHAILLSVLEQGIAKHAGRGGAAYVQTMGLLSEIVGSYRTRIAVGGGIVTGYKTWAANRQPDKPTVRERLYECI